MKIGYFNSGYLPDRGGVATFAGGLAGHMAVDPRVEAVKVVAFKNSQPRHEIRGKLEVFAFAGTGIWSMLWLTAKYIHRFRHFEVFHASNIFPVGFFVIVFAKLVFRKKVFLTLHGTDVATRQGSALVKWAKRYTLRKVDLALANSRSTMALATARQRVEAKQFAVIYPGVDDPSDSESKADVRKQYHLGPDEFVVLCVGQLIRRKGIDDLIRAVSKLSDSKIKLLIVGKGPEAENLKNLASQLHVSDRVIFAGSVASIASYYQASNVFAMTSKYLANDGDVEGLGLSILEAQYFGLPVIGTASGGIPETILDGKTGIIVPESDVDAIAEAILKLKNDRDLAKRMGGAGKQFVRENFSWERSVERHLEQYEKK